MTDSVGDILQRLNQREPAEIQIIRDFVSQKYQVPVGVTIQQTIIIISVPNGALAGSLRNYLHELRELLGTDKQLVLRINSP